MLSKLAQKESAGLNTSQDVRKGHKVIGHKVIGVTVCL